VAYGLSSAIGEKRNGKAPLELDSMNLDSQFRTAGFSDKGGGVNIDSKFIDSLGTYKVPSINGDQKIQIKSYSSDFKSNTGYGSTELRSLAKSAGFVAVIDTDSRTESGNQMQYTYNDASMGHAIHVINHSDNMINLQTGEQEPMYEVRDSFSKEPMTYWVSEQDLVTHLEGLVIVNDTSSVESK
jgi:hypothetical protein